MRCRSSWGASSRTTPVDVGAGSVEGLGELAEHLHAFESVGASRVYVHGVSRDRTRSFDRMGEQVLLQLLAPVRRVV